MDSIKDSLSKWTESRDERTERVVKQSEETRNDIKEKYDIRSKEKAAKEKPKLSTQEYGEKTRLLTDKIRRQNEEIDKNPFWSCFGCIPF